MLIIKVLDASLVSQTPVYS